MKEGSTRLEISIHVGTRAEHLQAVSGRTWFQRAGPLMTTVRATLAHKSALTTRFQ